MNLYAKSDDYFTTKENVKKTLDIFGVAVIPNILNPQECEDGEKGMWDYFGHISKDWEIPIEYKNPRSYRMFWKLFPMHSMLVQHWNAGHAQYVWDIRQNRNIINTFSEHIWGEKDEDMLVSFDAISLHLPPEITNRGYYRGRTWFHSDQSYLSDGLKCIQGYVTLRDINEGDATLSVLEGSHNYQKDFRERFNPDSKIDWYKLNEEEEEFYRNEKMCEEVRIKCPKGSLVLWDSRTIHCGVESLRNRPKENFRSIVYVCYTPRSLSSEKLIKKKQKAF